MASPKPPTTKCGQYLLRLMHQLTTIPLIERKRSPRLIWTIPANSSIFLKTSTSNSPKKCTEENAHCRSPRLSWSSSNQDDKSSNSNLQKIESTKQEHQYENTCNRRWNSRRQDSLNKRRARHYSHKYGGSSPATLYQVLMTVQYLMKKYKESQMSCNALCRKQEINLYHVQKKMTLCWMWCTEQIDWKREPDGWNTTGKNLKNRWEMRI